MPKVTSAVLMASCSVALASCQSVVGDKLFASHAAPAESAAVDLSGYFEQLMETGKTHLLQNRPALAVTAFRQASYDPAHGAAAYNGMGVAYAQMGRQDLARRYFQMALAADPEDERFVRNLARLETQNGSQVLERMLAQADKATVSTQAIVKLAAERSSIARADSSQGQPRAESRSRLVRVSGQEVKLTAPTVAQSESVSGSLTSDSSRRVVRIDRAYPVRIPLPARAASSQSSSYPVRIALAEPKATKRSSYPVRIELPAAD
jgi:tetratricopeptide (TPR) repeat protein